MAQTRPRFFVGFGFHPESELNRLYQEVNTELLERCGIPPLSRTHTPHLTLFPPPNKLPPEGTLEEVASRLLAVPHVTALALTLAVSGWDWFDGRKNSTLYLKVVPSKWFNLLVAQLAARMLGILTPNSAYPPHVSFARWITSEQRASVAAYMASRPPIPFNEIELDELSIFVKRDGGYQPHTSVSLRTA